jgi:hypothetical protein
LIPARGHHRGNRFGIAPKVETGEDDYPLLLLKIERAKRKSTQDCSTRAAIDELIEARSVRYVRLDPGYFVEKQAPNSRRCSS